MPTIYQQTANGLYATEKRTMTPFPSGLVRIDQSFVCATADADTHRETLAQGEAMTSVDTSPTIDGLIIYPTPNETTSVDGFTTFAVSGYGRRTSTIGNITKAQRLQALPTGVEAMPTLYFYLWEVAGTIVIPSDDYLQYDDLGLDLELLDPFGFYIFNTDYSLLSAEIIGTVPGTPPLNKTLNTWEVKMTTDGMTAAVTYRFNLLTPEINITSQRNFGAFTEIDVSTKPSTSLQTAV
jgi:hypothetical protein